MRTFGAIPALDDNRYQSKNFYSYAVSNASAVAANGQATLSFNIDGDSDFFWKYFSVVLTDNENTGVTTVVPSVTLLITNTETSRNYSNVPIAASTIAGAVGLPFILPMVTYFAAKAAVSVAVQEVGGNTYAANEIQLVFGGIKAFLNK